MLNRKEITNAAKRMLRQHRGLEDPQIIHPQRDWFIGLGVAVAVFILIAWWSITSYLHHSNADVDVLGEAGNTDTIYREAQVKAALELFSEKNKKYEELVGDMPVQPEILESVAAEEDSVLESELTDENVLEETPVVIEEVAEDVSVVEEEVTPEVLE